MNSERIAKAMMTSPPQIRIRLSRAEGCMPSCQHVALDLSTCFGRDSWQDKVDPDPRSGN
jgi:hypothetical protein